MYRALTANFLLIGLGLAITGLASACFAEGILAPVPWMIALGAGLYLAYTPFNGMLFDRLVAANGQPATAGFLIYVADSSGSVGSVALLLLRNVPSFRLSWTQFLIEVSLVTAIGGLVLMFWAALYLRRRLPS